MMSDPERYDKYVAWTTAIGAPTHMTFEEWGNNDSSPDPHLRSRKPTQDMAEVFISSVEGKHGKR